MQQQQNQLSLASIGQPQVHAVQCTIVGEGGMGKTTLAATFPNPVFILTENGMASFGNQAPPAFPVAKSSGDVMQMLSILANEQHNYQTVVIDSITKLNILIEQEVVSGDPKAQSINTACGGYGAGFGAVAEVHRQVKQWCDYLTETKGMNIVFIAHADKETVRPPDADEYTRYSLRMHAKSQSHYSDDLDLVGYIKLNTFVTGTGDKMKATTDGSRALVCCPTPSNVSKNRYGITQELPLGAGDNPLYQFIPSLQAQVQQNQGGQQQQNNQQQGQQ